MRCVLPTYRVERHTYGIAVYGPVPVDECVALVRVWSEEGFKVADAVIAHRLGASMVLVKTNRTADAWRQHIGAPRAPEHVVGPAR